MFVSDLAALDVSFEVALARLAALTGRAGRRPAPAGRGLPGRPRGTVTVRPRFPLGGFLNRIAEAITRAGAAAG